MTHIVFKTSNIGKTKEFWENILGLKNRSLQNNFLSYEVNGFIVNFSFSEHARDGAGIVGHFGFEFQQSSEVERQFQKLNTLIPGLTSPVGGQNKGPYRFYVQDPNGLRIEFESWEGCSD